MPPDQHEFLEPAVAGGREEDGERGAAGGQDRPGRNSRVFLWLLGILLLGIATIALPNEGYGRGLKALALEAVAIALTVLVLSRGDWTPARVRAAVTAAPNVAIALFLLWLGISYVSVLASTAGGAELLAQVRKMSQYEGMRQLGGGLLYFAVLYGLSIRRHLDKVVSLLVAAGILAAVVAFATYSESDAGKMAGAFRNSQLFGGVLALLLPVVVMAAISDEEGWRRLSAQCATVLILAGILANGNRSAWLGTLVAAAVVFFLWMRHPHDERQRRIQKHHLLVPLFMVTLAIGAFLYVSRNSPTVHQRTATIRADGGLQRDPSFQWRVGMWSKALRMVRDHPVMGRGIGTFPVYQAEYYHPDAPSRSQRTILTRGHGLSENAHNTYAQLAAETGLVGLALYLAIFVTYFVTAIPAIGRLRPGFRQSILIGCVGAVTAQMVAALGSPAWEYPECSLFLWLVLAVGMALSGVAERGRERVRRNRVERFHEIGTRHREATEN